MQAHRPRKSRPPSHHAGCRCGIAWHGGDTHICCATAANGARSSSDSSRKRSSLQEPYLYALLADTQSSLTTLPPTSLHALAAQSSRCLQGAKPHHFGVIMLRGCCRRLCSASALSPALQTLRVRQRAELQSLERKLVKLGAEERHTAVLRDSNSTSVFLLCTVGEFNAGKSSLLNALLGASFCRVGVLPTTEAITLLRHPSDATTGTALAASMGDPTQTPVVTGRQRLGCETRLPWTRLVRTRSMRGTRRSPTSSYRAPTCSYS